MPLPSLLSGAPRRRGYADAADFLRPFCAFMIGWYHIWQQSWLNPNLQIGRYTVDLFTTVAAGYMFVDLMLLLSGFLLMLGALERKPRSVGAFYAARLRRVYPSYLFCLLVMFFAFALPGKLYPSGRHMRIDVFSHLSFTHTLFDEGYHGTRLNGVLWTLAVEFQFYAIFPLLAKAFRKKPYLTWGLMTLAAWVARYLAGNSGDRVFFYVNQLPCMLDVYASGMMAAYVLNRLKGQGAARAWLSTLLTIAAAAAVILLVRAQARAGWAGKLYEGQLMRRWPLAVAGSVFLVCGSRSVKAVRALFSNRVTRFLGGISFNFYIWHQFLAVKLKEWHIPAYNSVENPNIAGEMPWQRDYTLLCFAAALAAALLATYLIEKPCARAPGKRKERK